MQKRDFTIVKGFRRYTGLMFRSSKTPPLVFLFDKPTNQSIHSWFVFFKFKAKWYDKDNNLIEERIISPFKGNIRPSKEYVKLVEIPIK